MGFFDFLKPKPSPMEMPTDWNDHKGWNKYYAANPIDFENLEDYEIEDSLRYFTAAANKKVWISGCGLELSPWLFSYLNCQILATDVSTAAIEFQIKLVKDSPFDKLNSLSSILEKLEIKPQKTFIVPKIRVEDFRITNPNDKFDVILNTKALQGLPNKDIEKAAKIFFDSNKEGGVFIASTMNVQGLKRTQIENAFLSAGYFIPNVKAEQWYRKKLDDTGILYVMVLGNPMVPQWGQYADKGGKEQEEKDREILKSYRAEYNERLKLNYEDDKENFRPEKDKLAYIIYNTG